MMDFHVKFMFRYGNMVALMKAGQHTRFEELEDLVYTTWSQLSGRIFKLSCLIDNTEFDFVNYGKNESSRVTAECKFKNKSNCGWRIQALHDKANDNFVIRSCYPDHKCGHMFGKASTKKFMSRVIVDLISNDICNIAGDTPHDVQSQVKDQFCVEISYMLLGGRLKLVRLDFWLPQQILLVSSCLLSFAGAERTNPDSVFDLDLNPIKKNFCHCFFAFGARLNRFKFCQPVWVIERIFMKGKCRGILHS